VTLVVKLGTSLIVDASGRVRRSVLAARAADVAAVGEPVCVVSSGAIALGLPVLGLGQRPRSTPRLQAASAAGQVRLQLAWEAAFRQHGLKVAQVLLSAADLAARASYLNVRNTLNTLLRLGVVPVVNENDATATDEITFGDNDALAAQVAVLLSARLLVLLTEVDGVYSGTAELLSSGDAVDEAAFGPDNALGRGGIASKVTSARLAAEAGIPTVIASGHGDGVITALAAGEARGTAFTPSKREASAFKLWLRHAKPVVGKLILDDGAREAILTGGRSLLAVGVAACCGSFEEGDAVELVALDGTAIGKGIVGASSTELRSRPRGVEAVHRDRLVLY
jgi:glutamate 5-kinase